MEKKPMIKCLYPLVSPQATTKRNGAICNKAPALLFRCLMIRSVAGRNCSFSLVVPEETYKRSKKLKKKLFDRAYARVLATLGRLCLWHLAQGPFWGAVGGGWKGSRDYFHPNSPPLSASVASSHPLQKPLSCQLLVLLAGQFPNEEVMLPFFHTAQGFWAAQVALHLAVSLWEEIAWCGVVLPYFCAAQGLWAVWEGRVLLIQ